MQSKKAVEIDRRFRAAIRFGNRDVRPQIVIVVLPVRDDDVESINRAALEDCNKCFAARGGVERFS